MRTNFDLALDYVFENEGGFANVKGDRGGATKYGITIGTLSRFRGTSCSVQDVKNLTEHEAKDIYFQFYWLPLSIDNVERFPIATCLFDVGIVRGLSIPPKYAQEVCNNLGFPLVKDGHIGPKTIEALNKVDEAEFVNHYAERVEQGFRAIVRGNPSQTKFLKGWVNRAERLRTLIGA